SQYFEIKLIDCGTSGTECIEPVLPLQHDYCIPHYYALYIFIRQPLENNGYVDHVFPENSQFDLTFYFDFDLAGMPPIT
ncbi:hypothetical protein KA005_83955, partial [bacterium]|nr:hypothetical protein [bacterium]